MVRNRSRACLVGVLASLCLALVGCSSATAAPVRGFSLHPNWWQLPPTGATDAELTHEVQAAHSIGANVVRVPLPWNQLEPSAAGQWNNTLAARVDGIMNALAANQMKAVVMVINTPCWASADPQVCVPFNPVYSLASAADPADFGGAVGRIVDRWGAQMAAVEVWNEPNNPSFFHGTPADYAAMIRAAATALDTRSWNGQLLAGALGMNATPSGLDWLTQLYAAGMTGEDAISIHPYDIYYDTSGVHFGDPLRPDSLFAQHIDGVRALMRAHGDASMGIWLTEFGADVCPATPICVSESDQSNWLVGMFAAAERRPFIRGSLAYSLRDPQAGSADMNYHFGVLRNDFTERPSAVALRNAFTSPPVATSAASRTLTVTKAGPGTVTGIPGAIINCGSRCSATVDDGSEFTLTETPGTGYRFTSWSGCSPVSANSCVVRIAGNKAVKATFTSTTPKLPPPPAGSTTAPSTQPPSTTAPSTKKKKKKKKKKRHHRH
jgi:polysaccharide biosynthesis protein PslG